MIKEFYFPELKTPIMEAFLEALQETASADHGSVRVFPDYILLWRKAEGKKFPLNWHEGWKKGGVFWWKGLGSHNHVKGCTTLSAGPSLPWKGQWIIGDGYAYDWGSAGML